MAGTLGVDTFNCIFYTYTHFIQIKKIWFKRNFIAVGF